jgi:hypothetical protein
VSTFPNYPSAASPEQLAGGPLPAQVAVAEAFPQQRVTVFFRLLLVIPHYIVLYFLGIAAGVVAFIGWWAALFTGWLPDFAVSYLTGYMRWYARVNAYVMLLTDVYPPYSLDDEPAYPVRIAVPPRQHLNPLAVFFRIILAIPALVLTMLVTYGGVTIVAFIAWLITLITGRLPNSLHAAYTAIFRYATRANCYVYMLTPAYPAGLFGDPPGPVGYAPPPGYGTPGAYGAPTDYGAPGGYGAPPGYGMSGGYGPPAYGGPQPPAQPTDWRLVLSSGTRQLLGVFIGLGVVFLVLEFVVIAIVASSNPVTTADAIATMNGANNTLDSEVNGWQVAAKACKSLACDVAGDSKAATYFTDFANTLHNTSMPSGATAVANKLYLDATTAAQDLSQLSQATSATQYQSIVTSTGLAQTLNQFDADDTALGTALDNSR